MSSRNFSKLTVLKEWREPVACIIRLAFSEKDSNMLMALSTPAWAVRPEASDIPPPLRQARPYRLAIRAPYLASFTKPGLALDTCMFFMSLTVEAKP